MEYFTAMKTNKSHIITWTNVTNNTEQQMQVTIEYIQYDTVIQAYLILLYFALLCFTDTVLFYKLRVHRTLC